MCVLLEISLTWKGRVFGGSFEGKVVRAPWMEVLMMSFQRACEVMKEIYLRHTNKGHSSQQTCLLTLIEQTRQYVSARKRARPQTLAKCRTRGFRCAASQTGFAYAGLVLEKQGDRSVPGVGPRGCLHAEPVHELKGVTPEASRSEGVDYQAGWVTVS